MWAMTLIQASPPEGVVSWAVVFAIGTPLLGFIAWIIRDRIQGLKDQIAYERAERAEERARTNKELDVWQERAWNGTHLAEGGTRLAEGGIDLARDSVRRRER